MDDDLHRRIEALVAEEHALRKGAGDPDTHRLRELEEQLDRTWDLLRQRQARRDAGQDPTAAAERRTDVVEGYLN